jgi:hypothetical protein
LQQLQNTNIGNNHFEDEVNNGNNGNTFKGTFEEPAQNRPMTASSYRMDTFKGMNEEHASPNRPMTASSSRPSTASSYVPERTGIYICI